MKNIKLTILTLSITLFVMPQLFSQTETSTPEKKWNVALSNAVMLKKMDNIQLEVNRKVMRTWLGLYFQATNDVLERPSEAYAADYLPKHGVMPQGTSWQFGGQIAWHLLRPDSKFDLWIKYRAGLNRSNRYNNPGTYWYLDETKVKEFYTIAEKQHKKIGTMEMSLGIGLSYKISDNFSVFIEPALNCQFFAQNFRTYYNEVMIEALFPIRYGVCFAF